MNMKHIYNAQNIHKHSYMAAITSCNTQNHSLADTLSHQGKGNCPLIKKTQHSYRKTLSYFIILLPSPTLWDSACVRKKRFSKQLYFHSNLQVLFYTFLLESLFLHIQRTQSDLNLSHFSFLSQEDVFLICYKKKKKSWMSMEEESS